jgi:hypothetical protein
MSFEKLLSLLTYNKQKKRFFGKYALDEIVVDFDLESTYCKDIFPKNLGLFDINFLKKKDVLSFKKFMFERYPSLFFIIKQVDDFQFGIKAVKRQTTKEIKHKKLVFETIQTHSDESSFTTIFSNKENFIEYKKSQKVILQEAKKKEVKVEKKEDKEKDNELKKITRKPDPSFHVCYNSRRDTCKLCRFGHL